MIYVVIGIQLASYTRGFDAWAQTSSGTWIENLARHTRNALQFRPAAQVTTFIASDYYLDCTKTVMEVAIIFLAQCSLLGFYLLGLYTDGTPNFSNGRVFAFYYAGASSTFAPVLHILIHM